MIGGWYVLTRPTIMIIPIMTATTIPATTPALRPPGDIPVLIVLVVSGPPGNGIKTFI